MNLKQRLCSLVLLCGACGYLAITPNIAHAFDNTCIEACVNAMLACQKEAFARATTCETACKGNSTCIKTCQNEETSQLDYCVSVQEQCDFDCD
jgi:hypothetical protein